MCVNESVVCMCVPVCMCMLLSNVSVHVYFEHVYMCVAVFMCVIVYVCMLICVC